MIVHEETEKRWSAYLAGTESCHGPYVKQQGSHWKLEIQPLYHQTTPLCAYVPIKEKLQNAFAFNFQGWRMEKEEIREFNQLVATSSRMAFRPACHYAWPRHANLCVDDCFVNPLKPPPPAF